MTLASLALTGLGTDAIWFAMLSQIAIATSDKHRNVVGYMILFSYSQSSDRNSGFFGGISGEKKLAIARGGEFIYTVAKLMTKHKTILTILITIIIILAGNSFEYFTGLHDFFGDKSYFIKEIFSSLKKIVFYSGPIIVYILLKRENYGLFDGINRRFTNKRVYGIWGLWLVGLIGGKIFLPQYYPSLETSRNLFFYILVVNSIVEEGVFRGFIMAKLEQFYSKIKANIVQAFLFAIIHSPFYISIITKSQNPQMGFGFMLTLCIMLLDVFVLALIRGYIKQKTQSLRPTIVLHSIHNGVVLFFTT